MASSYIFSLILKCKPIRYHDNYPLSSEPTEPVSAKKEMTIINTKNLNYN